VNEPTYAGTRKYAPKKKKQTKTLEEGSNTKRSSIREAQGGTSWLLQAKKGEISGKKTKKTFKKTPT